MNISDLKPSTTLILIRHAEKLDWKQGLEPTEAETKSYKDNHSLSPKGFERAHALVGYFTAREEIVKLFENRALAGILVQDVDQIEHWGKSQRPLETIMPLLKNDSIDPLDARFEYPLQLQLFTKSRLLNMIEMIKSGKFANKSVIVSWNHAQLSEILGHLGMIDPPKWPKKRFDVTWIFDTGDLKFKQIPQMLLYGDCTI